MVLPDRFSGSTGGDFSEMRYRDESEVRDALLWAIYNLSNSDDNPVTFEVMEQVLQEEPELVLEVITSSNDLARQKLGQEREGKSPATMLGTIDAAIKVVANRHKIFPDEAAFSGESWTPEKMIEVLEKHMQEVVELAGANTTSKNLPHRASQLLWMIDQSPLIPNNPQFAFLELGSSGGLILDALREPRRFAAWMNENGYEKELGKAFSEDAPNATLGVDLVVPTTDWLKALILDDTVRAEVSDFIRNFSRSLVVEGNAVQFAGLSVVEDFFRENSDKIPFIYCTSMLYQLSVEQRAQVVASIRSVLQNLGGGLMMLSDYGPNRGYPEIDGNVAWIEDERGMAYSPKIYKISQSGTHWSVIDE